MRHFYRALVSAVTAAALISQPVLACSLVAVKEWSPDGAAVANTIVARNMDYEQQLFFGFGVGMPGAANISDVNFYAGLPDSAVATWTNTHKFVGRLSLTPTDVVDGVNDAGLFAGMLMLPDFTQYPVYNSADSRKALAASDVANFVLGTAGSVAEALAKLRQYQIVESGAPLTIGGKTIFIDGAQHLVLQDKTGDSAIVEYIGGKTKIWRNVGVVTNGPTYKWQVENFNKQFANFKNYNTTQTWDGHYLNGSGLSSVTTPGGYLGLEGSYASVDRFVMGSALLAFSPKAKNSDEAFVIAQEIINKLRGAFGATVAPTLYTSVVDLGRSTYYTKTPVLCAAGKNFALAPTAANPGAYRTVKVSDVPIKISNIPGGGYILPPDFYYVSLKRAIKYVDPQSPLVLHSASPKPGASYDVNFVDPAFCADPYAVLKKAYPQLP